MSDKIVLSGQTRFERNGQHEMLHQAEIIIEPGQVTTTLKGYGDGCADHPPIPSNDPEVERYLRDVDQALQVTAYRNRPIQSRFKTPKRRRSDSRSESRT